MRTDIPWKVGAYRITPTENNSVDCQSQQCITFTLLYFLVSRFMGYHTILKTSADFIDALKSARKLAKEMSTKTESHVFAYR